MQFGAIPGRVGSGPLLEVAIPGRDMTYEIFEPMGSLSISSGILHGLNAMNVGNVTMEVAPGQLMTPARGQDGGPVRAGERDRARSGARRASRSRSNSRSRSRQRSKSRDSSDTSHQHYQPHHQTHIIIIFFVKLN